MEYLVFGLAIVVALGFGVGMYFALRPDPDEDEELEGGESPGIEVADEAVAVRPAPSVMERFKAGLARTSDALGLRALFGGTQVDEALFESLEEALITGDVGVHTTTALLEELRAVARDKDIQDPGDLKAELVGLLGQRVARFDPALKPRPATGPHVILVVGVNGAGKTTTIGKLAHSFKQQGHKVLVAAGDTFRAGAIEQLAVWAQRSGAEIVKGEEGGDPASVMFNALKAAEAQGCDIVLCDTAGRLQARKPLMEELGKVTRVIGKACPGAPHEVLLVLDGTMGQNALSQARVFGEVTGVTGVALTKLDGTARGGVVIAVMDQLSMPVKFIGIGEGIDDLRPFDGQAFVEALIG